MSARRWHHAGHLADEHGRIRGLCWCGWRGDPRRNSVLARRDADAHVAGAGS